MIRAAVHGVELSAEFIEAVLSITIAMLYGAVWAPRIDAVEVAVMVIVGMPMMEPKYMGRFKVCETTSAFAPRADVQVAPKAVTVLEQ